MSRRHRSSFRPMADMNLTSMSDLTFLLLITFIITFPMIEQGISVKLPKSDSAPVETVQEGTVVSVQADGRIFIGTNPVLPDAAATEDAQISALREELGARLASDPELQLVIRGDADAKFGTWARVAALAKELKIDKLTMSFDPSVGNAGK